jgi:hypothetical protein
LVTAVPPSGLVAKSPIVSAPGPGGEYVTCAPPAPGNVNAWASTLAVEIWTGPIVPMKGSKPPVPAGQL